MVNTLRTIRQRRPTLVILLIGLIIGAGALFESQNQRIQNQVHIQSLFIDLLSDNANLNQAQIQLYKQRILNFDPLNSLITDMTEETKQLKQALKGFPQLSSKTQLITPLLQQKQSLLEKLKADLAIFNNSYKALPELIHLCAQKHASHQNQIDTLIYPILENQPFSKIYQQAQQTPSLHQCVLLLNHLNILKQTTNKLTQTEAALTKLHLSKTLQKMHSDYMQALLKIYQKIEWLTYLLLGLVLGLAFIIWTVIQRLNITNQALKQALHTAEKNHHLYQALSETNQAMMHIQNETELFQKVTDNLHQHIQVPTCWIGKLEGNKVQPIAQSGMAREAIYNANITLTGDYVRGRILADKVVAENRAIIIDDYVNQKKDSPYYQTIVSWGIRSMAIYPIHGQDAEQVYGLLFLYSTELNFFDAETDRLIQELVEDIEFALHKLELEAQQAHLLHEQKIAAIAFETQEAIFITDAQHRIIRLNQAAQKLFGYDENELLGKTPKHLTTTENKNKDPDIFRKAWLQVRKQGHWQGDILVRHKSGRFIPVQINLSAVYNTDGQITHFIAHMTDRTSLVQAQSQIQKLKQFDGLTKLPNREHLKQTLEKYRQSGLFGFLVLINLSGFKHINDALGNEAGDQILQEVAKRLQEILRTPLGHEHNQGSLVSRISADEFILFSSYPNISTCKNALFDLFDKIDYTLHTPFKIQNESITLNYNAGVVILRPSTQEHPTDWLRQVDIALHQAKEDNTQKIVFYETTMQDEVLKRHETERELEKALKHEEFVMYYQPQIDLTSGKVIGAESLIRWQNSNGELVPPFQFIPVLESSHLMLPVGRWIIQNVIHTIARLHQELSETLLIAINLSGEQFTDEHLANFILNTIQEAGVPNEMVELEVTESMLMNDLYATQETLKALQAQGCKIAIDDFGTGYSSFSYLKQFSANKLKIDKMFIDHIEQPKDAALVRAMIEMSHALGAIAIAEGAETADQIDHLKLLGCDEIQGYYYSKPLPLEAFIEFVKQKNNIHSGSID